MSTKTLRMMRTMLRPAIGVCQRFCPHSGSTGLREHGPVPLPGPRPSRGGRFVRLPDMSAPLELPPVVSAAFEVSLRHGYASFCRNETGRLLAALAATRTGTLAEFGTGTGV